MEEFDDAEERVLTKINKIMNIKGSEPAETFHRSLGLVMWNKCGMSRTEKSLKEALNEIPSIKNDFWTLSKIPGKSEEFNPYLERACRIADYLEFAELMCYDALHRSESCGGHFREESQTPDGEAQRKDDKFCYVGAWKYNGKKEPTLFKEELIFENIALAQRSYK
jgi:succinate dehydrogenase / fumarate reductase flavoprotein subunit